MRIMHFYWMFNFMACYVHKYVTSNYGLQILLYLYMKTLESPLDCKEIQPVHSKGDQFWVFFGRNDPKAETPVLWPPHAKSWLIGKDPDAGRDWGQEEKGMTGWDGWMASLTRWTWVWVNSGSWWWTGRQRVRHDWEIELNWTDEEIRLSENITSIFFHIQITWIH